MAAIDTQTVDTTTRLAALRKLMSEHKVDAYVVPSEDQRKGFQAVMAMFDGGSTRVLSFLQIPASTLQTAISVEHSYPDSLALPVRLSTGGLGFSF
jgi:Xaa-Pro aminopeptidase